MGLHNLLKGSVKINYFHYESKLKKRNCFLSTLWVIFLGNISVIQKSLLTFKNNSQNNQGREEKYTQDAKYNTDFIKTTHKRKKAQKMVNRWHNN